MLDKILKVFKSNKDFASSYKAVSEAAYLQTQIKKPKYKFLTKLLIYTLLYTYVLSVAFNILLIKENKLLESSLYKLKTTIEAMNKNNRIRSPDLVEVEVVIEKTKDGVKNVEVKEKH